jgi:amiloride-sensitive sodium channel
VLHIYYKDKTGVRYKTDIRFGIEDFICMPIVYLIRINQLNLIGFDFSTAAAGGLLGLGLGLSFISVFELLFFLCLSAASKMLPSLRAKSRNKDEALDCHTLQPDNKWTSTTTVGTNVSIS